MVRSGQPTGLCALWALSLLLVGQRNALAANDAQTRRAVPTAIPAQPLTQALAAFTSSTHLQLVYASQLALGRNSQAVAAGLPATTALAQLLEGTGLGFQFLNDRTVKLFERPSERVPATDPGPRLTNIHSSAIDSLEEVVVSATKRDEFLSTVPMSITVLSPEDLEASGIQGIAGIAAVSTGVEYDFSPQYGPGILTNIAIRGISADKGDATTGIYVDDTPIQTPHTTFGNAYPVTFDLAQVEVLRGPQGVLFGRGAEGGAIRFITNEPSTSTVSRLYRSEISTTDRGGTSVEMGAAVGGPLVADSVGARVSVWYRSDGGYVNRVDPFTGAVVDADANRSVSRAARISLAFEPGDSLRITPSFSYQSIDLHDTPAFYADPPTPKNLENGKLLRQPSSDDLTIGSLTLLDRLGAANLTAITSYVDRTASATVDTTNVAGVVYFGGFGNPLGPAFPTSYADAVPTLLTLHQIQLSEEVRLASTDSAAPVKWLGGFFFSRLRQDLTQDTYLISAPADPGILTDGYDTFTESSAFGQARWSLNSYWSAGSGMRVGWLEDHSTSHAAGFANAGSAPFAQSSARESLPPTPRFDLSYQPDSRNLFYTAIAKGFRAGGGGGTPARCAGSVDPSSFGPDSVWSFELGAKNELFDRRLHLDASLFDIRWSGIQERLQDSCGNSFTTNAGVVRSKGFDLGADALLADGFQLAVAVGYLDVRYTRTLQTAGGQIIVDRGTVVGGIPSVPAPWSGTVSVRYEWPLIGKASAYLRAEEIAHSHNPGPFTEQDPNSLSYNPGLSADPAYNLLNLQVGATRSGLNIRLFANNLTNSRPMLQRYSDAPGSALVYAYTLRPRTVGLLGTWTF
ncbi:MAG TPA: TonB-dependent receptor [Steroidobacteraceae bacterium]|nr:TonB-dependent receptor [Steroidobacteraceae bacterium]